MRRENTRTLTITAIFVALLLVQTFVPNIGYVRIIPTLPAITTIPLTIAIYATLMGPKPGFLFGLFWGLTRLVVAYTQPGDMVSLLLFQNPIISLVPSILAGWLPGLLAKSMSKKGAGMRQAGYALNGVVTSLTNTVMVILLASLFFMNNPASLSSYLGHFSAGTPLIVILLTALGVNGLTEAIFTGLVVPVIVMPLNYVLKRS